MKSQTMPMYESALDNARSRRTAVRLLPFVALHTLEISAIALMDIAECGNDYVSNFPNYDDVCASLTQNAAMVPPATDYRQYAIDNKEFSLRDEIAN